MNKLNSILIIALSVLSVNVYGQCNEVKKALKELNNNELSSSILSLDSAEILIKEQGIENIDEKCLAKYYFGRGATYFEKAKKEGDLSTKISLFDKSQENYNLFLKLNQKPEDLVKLTQSNIYSLSIEFLNVAVDLYQKQDYKQALYYTEKGIDIKQKYHPTMLENQDLYNAMICARLSENYPKALVYADTLLNKKNTPEKTFDYQLQKVEILAALNQNDKALELIKTMKDAQPNNVNLKITELQIYLNQNQNKEALVLLEEICKTITDREDLLVVKGQIHYQEKQNNQAVEAFNKVIQLNPNNTSALYGLAVVYVNYANEVIENMKTANNQTKENESILNGHYTNAITYLEKVIAIKPQDKDTLNALISIYRSKGEQEKVNFYQEKINSIK